MPAPTTVSFLDRSDADGVVTLCLNQPRQFNVLSEAMMDALVAALVDIGRDPSVRCVVLSAAGKAFCAGHDLREMRSQPQLSYYQSLFARCSRLMHAIRAVPVPVIARVHGVATAAGCQLVAACDLAVAGQSARFAVSGINVGLFCATPSVALSRNIPTKHAFGMLVTGDFIDADTAVQWGLINQAVPDDELDTAVAALTAKITEKSAAAIRHGKALFYQQQNLPLDQAYALAGEVMAQNMLESDAMEGIDAFLEKRPARRVRS